MRVWSTQETSQIKCLYTYSAQEKVLHTATIIMLFFFFAFHSDTTPESTIVTVALTLPPRASHFLDGLDDLLILMTLYDFTYKDISAIRSTRGCGKMLTEYDVLAVEPAGGDSRDEELESHWCELRHSPSRGEKAFCAFL